MARIEHLLTDSNQMNKQALSQTKINEARIDKLVKNSDYKTSPRTRKKSAVISSSAGKQKTIRSPNRQNSAVMLDLDLKKQMT